MGPECEEENPMSSRKLSLKLSVAVKVDGASAGRLELSTFAMGADKHDGLSNRA
jgi:hypothetical protein